MSPTTYLSFTYSHIALHHLVDVQISFSSVHCVHGLFHSRKRNVFLMVGRLNDLLTIRLRTMKFISSFNYSKHRLITWLSCPVLMVENEESPGIFPVSHRRFVMLVLVIWKLSRLFAIFLRCHSCLFLGFYQHGSIVVLWISKTH